MIWEMEWKERISKQKRVSICFFIRAKGYKR